mmetsp:Transcript_13331/g.25051  ORF Transcript_13331/g.25051 Transcript_13331/m.25051 type:complete len:555 (+) Transcript_13331:137-1801(+)|eukprot:CAMPEP_0178765934 /NCGR_PEP_ID=MMETSP0744-20121128/18753_1 /TAXON_ID=913974 /ORGANISM="Nitzschia punctata, Strain CCMP561" /LENGTH=554 /DNA_ID=CAMNT_0020421537 /DNA_START=121 /DNA_END=1785 /DNA_ORIENTATION=+
MSSADDSTGGSGVDPPSAAATSGDTSQGNSSPNPGGDSPVGMEVVDRSQQDPSANEAQALKLKEQGNEQLIKGHFLEAIGFYSDALEYSPTNSVILSNRAQAYIKVENYGLAMADATAALESDPKYAKAYYRRGSAQFALGHLKDSRKDFRKVCQLQPKSKDARAKLQACEKAIREEAFRKAIESEMTSPLSDTYDPNALAVSVSYDGPNPLLLEGPTDNMELEASLFEPGNLSREFVLASMERFKNQKLIHKRYVARLLLSCKKYFESLDSLMDIEIPTEPPEHDPTAAPRVTVCGDTHGQFYDVLNIFEMNGHPSPKNPYLFNGDFVDRGSFSVEVILTYLLWKIHDPTCIYLTRGNHETKNMNKIYGFEGEVKAKYDDKIFELFLEVFCHLPLAAVVGKKVFVTHGGLSTDESVMLDDIRKIKRGVEPPEAGLMSDLLWSDPQPFPGRSPSKRGVGFAFGPDITERFLERNSLSLLVRSHEVKEEGYLVEHGGKTITVFSAPNYCDTMGNKGAFIHFDKSLEPKFTQYTSVPHPDVKPMAYSAGMGGIFGL